MPTEASTVSRSRRIAREYATRGGTKPIKSRTLGSVAPKIAASHLKEEDGDQEHSTASIAESLSLSELRSVNMNYFVVQGSPKYHLLHSLVANSGKSKKIIVRFATKEIASFYCEALLAADVDAPILCDVEDDMPLDDAPPAAASIGPEPAKVVRKGVPGAKVLRDVVSKFASMRSGCVLLTAFGLSSPKADVVLHFDPPQNIATFVRSNMLAASDDSHAATRIVLLDPVCHSGVLALVKQEVASLLRNCTAPIAAAVEATPAKKAARKESSKGSAADAVDSNTMKPTWRFERLPTPSQASQLIQGNTLRSLGKKIFTVNNKAHAAYRAYMQFYLLLKPKAVFDVKKLDLDQQASAFGLESAPLLDLRSKSNQFRPKEDVHKHAMQRYRQDLRSYREYAEANILPEAAEESDAEPDAADEAAGAAVTETV